MSEAAGSSLTRLLDGTLLLRQATRGHRAGTDAILLAAATTPHPGDTVIDIGSGVGSVGLAVAVRHRDVRVRLLEIEPALAALARDNITLNRLEARVLVETGDVFEGPDVDGAAAAWVVSNPPYQVAGEGRGSPDGLRARAHTLAAQRHTGLGHGDWLRAMLRRAAPHAALLVIHRPDALPALLAAAEGRLGQIRVMPIHAYAKEPAIRMLFGGILGSRAPFGLVEPLVLHEVGGVFTARAERLHRGEESLPLIATRKGRP